MGKNITRWYEKNEYLKAFMSLLEDLPTEIQCEIAVDIIIEASSLIDRQYSNIVKDVANFNPQDFKRWYDKNPNIHVAIESLKDLTDEQKEIIIKKYYEKILNSHYIKIEGLED